MMKTLQSSGKRRIQEIHRPSPPSICRDNFFSMTFCLRTCSAALSLLLSTTLALAQSGTPALMAPMANPDPRLAQIHASMSGVHAIGQVAISPDGKFLAWTSVARQGGTLHLTELANPVPAKEKIVAPNSSTNCSNGYPAFSPDSRTLAYTSSCTSKQNKPGEDQIFLYSVRAGTSAQITHFNGIFQHTTWSPDGKYLSFLFVENASRSAGALAAMKPWAGVIDEDGVEIQRVAVVPAAPAPGAPAATGPTFLTPANLHVYEFSWNPTASEITFIAANPPGENNWWVAKLYTQTQAQAPKVVFDPNTTTSALHGLQIAVPRFSPDGKHIAFIGGLMSDQGSTGGDIWVLDPSAKEAPTNVTPGIDGSPTFLAWTGDDSIGFVEDRSGHSLLTNYVVSAARQDASIDLGEVGVSGGTIKNAVGISRNGTLAFVKSGHATAPEIWAGPFESLTQITHLNDGIKTETRTESVEWTNPVEPGRKEVLHVQGWLTYPANYDAKKKYPILVTVHGGPSASAGAQFSGSVWAQLGYFVFAPNPRGSFGQGEKFTAANRKDFGYGDLRDITSGLDSIEARLPIDKQREGLMGWSYGGFMTMFGVTQTTRFRAAVAGAGLSDWLSYYGENSIDQWMVPFFGATVYDDPAVYAKSSAINFIKKVKTPTLVVVGDRDGECPAPQSFEFWHALRAEGVKTQLVVFPNEGHGFRDPAHIRDLEAREVAWFAENMPAN